MTYRSQLAARSRPCGVQNRFLEREQRWQVDLEEANRSRPGQTERMSVETGADQDDLGAARRGRLDQSIVDDAHPQGASLVHGLRQLQQRFPGLRSTGWSLGAEVSPFGGVNEC